MGLAQDVGGPRLEAGPQAVCLRIENPPTDKELIPDLRDAYLPLFQTPTKKSYLLKRTCTFWWGCFQTEVKYIFQNGVYISKV